MNDTPPRSRLFAPWAEMPLAIACVVLAVVMLIWKTVGVAFLPANQRGQARLLRALSGVVTGGLERWLQVRLAQGSQTRSIALFPRILGQTMVYAR